MRDIRCTSSTSGPTRTTSAGLGGCWACSSIAGSGASGGELDRHRAGTDIARAGGIGAAQRLLGHASVATTEIYADFDLDELRAAMQGARQRAA